MMPKLKTRGLGTPVIPEDLRPNGPSIFQQMPWEHRLDWGEARLKSLVLYLKGNTNLRLPENGAIF